MAGLGLNSAKENTVGWLIAGVGAAGVGQHPWGPGAAAPGARAVTPTRPGVWGCAWCQGMLPATGSGVQPERPAGAVGCAAVDRCVRCADELQLCGPWDSSVLPVAQGLPQHVLPMLQGSGTALTEQLIWEQSSAVLAPLLVL